MTEEVNFNLDVAKEAMQEVITRLESALAKIRAGKANPQMLSAIKINYYGVQTPLAQAANISTADAQTISIQPFDKSLITDIEQAIVEANLGFNSQLVMKRMRLIFFVTGLKPPQPKVYHAIGNCIL